VYRTGLAIGYSTIWWARAVGEGGRVIYTDGDRKKADEARRYFDHAGVSQTDHSQTGDALELLPKRNSSSTSFSMTSTKKTIPRLQAGPAASAKGRLFVD